MVQHRPQRTRIRFSKHGKLRFLSHRDVARVWERALRRASLPVAYTEGFSPRPKLSFGLALSTGYESRGEYLDVELRPGEELDPAVLAPLLSPLLPDGIEVQAAEVLDPGVPSLQQAVTSCTWHIEVAGADGAPPPEAQELRAAVRRALDASQLLVEIERKGSRTTEDLRPGIIALDVLGPDAAPLDPGRGGSGGPGVLVAELVTQPRSLRPSELLRALEPTWREGRVTRINQWTSVDGARREPIGLAGGGATSAPHARARAS